MVALIREGAVASRRASQAEAPAAGADGTGAETLLQRMVGALAWRDAYARADVYPVEVGGATLPVRQVRLATRRRPLLQMPAARCRRSSVLDSPRSRRLCDG